MFGIFNAEKAILGDEPYPRVMGNKSGHAVKLQQHLYDQMQAQCEFCDVTLVIGTVEMKAHWSVLVSCPYFQSLYDSGMTERQAGKVTISIGKTPAVRSAISFLYTGQLEVSYTNVKDVLEVADYFQIDDLKQACASYLSSVDVNVENCISLSLLSSLYDLDIYNKVFDYVRGHLPEVMQQTEILSLTPDSILEMLRDKSLNYVELEDFFNFIVKWVEADILRREKYFESMFCELDLNRMSKDFIDSKVEPCKLVNESAMCKSHLRDVKRSGLRSHEDTSDVILLIGGCGVGQFFHSFFTAPYYPLSDVISVSHVYGYVVNEDRWTELAPLPYTMRRPLATYNKSEHCLYVYDASTSAQIDNNILYIFKYSIREKLWTNMRVTLPEGYNEITIQQILFCRNKLFVVASGKILEAGNLAQDWNVCLFSVSSDGLHSELKGKLFPRSVRTQVSACVVDDTYVCVLGGKCGRGGSHSQSQSRGKIVRFVYLDARTGKKTDSSKGAYYEPLMLPVNNELILAKPGYYKHRKFNFATKKWMTVKGLLVPHPVEEPARTDFIYTTYQNQLVIFGGKSTSSKKLLDNACSYNLGERKWKNLQNVPKAVTNCGVVVAKIPKEHIKCHIDCPHCAYSSVRSRAVYQIDYPEEEDDDDDYEDISYEEDEEMYSDYWNDDLYDDNIPDFGWYGDL